MSRDEATEAQVRAANPASSTWLAANAGSGKTRVLTDRVARLLLGGTTPEKILCLTYTKAAASEMQNRLFKRLGEWAMLPDEELRAALDVLGHEETITADRLADARSLFARAIETPGGLKIQTIHAFCAAVLRRFPLEAGVSPQFQEMEDRAGDLLRDTILQDMAAGENAGLVEALASHLTDPTFEGITKAIASVREQFTPPLTEADMRTVLDLPDEVTAESVASQTLTDGDHALIVELIPMLRASGGNDEKAAEKLAGIHAWSAAALPLLENVFLTGPGAKIPFAAKIGSFPKKALREGDACALMPMLDDLMARIEDGRDLRLRAALFEKTRDLHAFANAFLSRYANAKAARGWLDFDDLITRTRDLLSDQKVADWVLYRLDGGIEHILVDEAQDTSPVQWDVIERLAEEFTSGRGVRGNDDRTIFVVGDKKQSIYSFQGADPSGFDRMRDRFATKLGEIQAPFQDRTLQFSFRSSAAILDIVDQVFQNHEPSGFSPDAPHRAFHESMPGRVDLWPVIEKSEPGEERHWTDTVDQIDPAHENVRLARKIAGEIGRLLVGNDLLPVKEDGNWVGRKIQPKDILILVQRRSALFEEIIRACKAADLPIAGADRLKVGAELAVRDLGALLAWLALPEDDLSLATALRSPLFGWSEQALFTLAHDRKEPYLWRTLEARSDQHAETWAILKDLRDNADFLRPYDLIERILIRHKGRAKLLARLGAEAEDGIDALLEQAIAYETSEIPSLTGFLLWMQVGDFEIKRQPDAASDQIRVMTVHGAKGLEAPIVILPDCAQRRSDQRGALVTGEGLPFWQPNKDEQPQLMRPWLDARSESEEQERDRMLYVAVTRAESWLIVAAAGELGRDGAAWHDRVRNAMEELGSEPLGEGGLRYSQGGWPKKAREDQSHPKAMVKVPPWAHCPTEEADPELVVFTPTELGGPKALPGPDGQDEDAAKKHGTQVHYWLEQLAKGPTPQTPADDPAYAEALRVRETPALAAIFGPNALSEVALSAFVPLLAQRMHGVIDQLVITPGDILAIDYKTNVTIPKTPDEVPEGLLRQMGAYAHMLAEIYPDRKIRTAILWTRNAELMELPHDLVTDALRTTTLP